MDMTAPLNSVLPAPARNYPSKHVNRRRGRRHRLHVPATFTPENGGTAVHGCVVELSVGGLGMTTHDIAEIGSVFVVSAYDTLLPPGLRVKVVSHRATSHGHVVGAAIL